MRMFPPEKNKESKIRVAPHEKIPKKFDRLVQKNLTTPADAIAAKAQKTGVKYAPQIYSV